MNRSALWLLIASLSAVAFGCPSARPADTDVSLSSHAAGSSSDAGAEFVFCAPGNFANCTTAPCEANDAGGYSCKCDLDTRFSVTTAASGCQPAKGNTLQSRYYPIESYQICSDPKKDTSEWAWCLGFPCQSRGDSVICDCPPPPSGVSHFPYIITTSDYDAAKCKLQPGKVWSSATPGDSAQITEFLQHQPKLQNLAAPVVLTGK